MSDDIKCNCIELTGHIAMSSTGVLIHGTSPNDFLKSIVIPIPKGRGNLTDSANYRSIALSSAIVKLLDLIVLTRYSDIISGKYLWFAVWFQK